MVCKVWKTICRVSAVVVMARAKEAHESMEIALVSGKGMGRLIKRIFSFILLTICSLKCM